MIIIICNYNMQLSRNYYLFLNSLKRITMLVESISTILCETGDRTCAGLWATCCYSNLNMSKFSRFCCCNKKDKESFTIFLFSLRKLFSTKRKIINLKK